MTGRGRHLAGEGTAPSEPAGGSVVTSLAKCPLCGRTPQSPHASGKDFRVRHDGDEDATSYAVRSARSSSFLHDGGRAAFSDLSRELTYAYVSFTAKKTLATGSRRSSMSDRPPLPPPRSRRFSDPGFGLRCGRLLRIFADRGVPRIGFYGMELDGGAVRERARKAFGRATQRRGSVLPGPFLRTGGAPTGARARVGSAGGALKSYHSVLVPGAQP